MHEYYSKWNLVYVRLHQAPAPGRHAIRQNRLVISQLPEACCGEALAATLCQHGLDRHEVLAVSHNRPVSTLIGDMPVRAVEPHWMRYF